MKPNDVQLIGEELAIRWDDGSEDYIPLLRLRQACPCAECKGEVDVLGQLHKGPERPLSAASHRLVRVIHVGGYALQPFWGDGHSSGLYPFDYLKRLGRDASSSG